MIEPRGWELDNFRRNPVVLWAHQSRELPVGRALDVRVQRDALVADVEFAPTERGQQVFELYRQRFMRAFSVGFMPLEAEPIRHANGKTGTRFIHQELFEFSAVPVPANADALARMVARALGQYPAGAALSLAGFSPQEVGNAVGVALARVLSGQSRRPALGIAPEELARSLETAIGNVIARHLGRVHYEGRRIRYQRGRSR